ncbi:MAG: 50S ribosomal protein L3 [Magnetococcales bacterium]|nr:50S ribosomal protein L3 [Magnetococcales bacterium]
MGAGLIGRKLGMTRIFTDEGKSWPVTVLQAGPCHVVGIKSAETHGYNAIQLGFEEMKPSRGKKPVKGVYAKANVTPKRVMREFRVEDSSQYEIGQALTVDLFPVNKQVDVTGQSVGKGFAGVMKRWGFHGGRATHGTHLTHRSPGSIGQCQTPGRVFKNKKMAGHMGDARITVQNLVVTVADPERNLLVVKGSVPGAKGSVVLIRDAVKGAVKS